MKVAVTRSAGRVEIEERAIASVADDEVAVTVQAVGVCGTDAHIWSGHYAAAALPLVQGHEIAGSVDGARVVVDPARSCGRCFACGEGRGNACARSSVLGVHRDGALAEVIAVPRARVHPAPELSVAAAALVEPTAIALQAVERSQARPGRTALVLGCGTIGLLAVRALTDRGVRVAAVDRARSRIERAARFGADVADVVDDPMSADQHAWVREWSGGEGPTLVVEATGAAASLAAGLDLVVSAGRVVAVGISTDRLDLAMGVLPYKELDLVGSRNSRDLFPEAIAFTGRHEKLAEELITHRVPFARAHEALEQAARSDGQVGKILVELAS